MKRFISTLLSVVMLLGVFSISPIGVFAAKKRVSLKKSSVTIRVGDSSTIKVKKAKGVKLKKVTYKSSDKKIVKVTKKGKVTAKKKGTAAVTVKVKYTYKKKTYKKSLKYKVKVKKAKKLNNDYYSKLSAFSNKLYNMSAKKEKGNYTMSPVSVYMALAMLHSVGSDAVKKEIESFTEMTESDFSKTGALFNSLKDEYKNGDELVRKLSLTNSIWFDESELPNPTVLDKMKADLYCSAHQVKFKNDNKGANKEIREFIKKQTNGMIDRDFDLSPKTLYALINTLYFKDIWDYDIEQLSTSKKDFNTDSGKKKCEFLNGMYTAGQVAKTSNAEYFYATTAGGYKVKFVLPNKGVTVKQAMTAAKLNEINAKSGFGEIDKNGVHHYTRCIFPSFKITSDTPLLDIFKENNVLQNAFGGFYSPLSLTPLQLDDIKHTTVLDVNKKGIEGAAVTIFAMKAGAALIQKEYHEFVLDRPFGFIVTSPKDVVLFEGQFTNP